MNRGINFFRNLVGSTPISPFPYLSSPPSSSLPFPYFPLPFLPPLSPLPYSFITNPLPSPQIQLGVWRSAL